MVICLERSADDCHIVQVMPLLPIICCFIKIQNGSIFFCSLPMQVVLERLLNGLVITFAEEGGYVFSSVCLSVCLFVCLSVGLLANL